MKTVKHVLVILILFGSNSLSGQEQNNQAFNINDYAWLAGTWTGEGFGGITEEIWSMPSGDEMVGLFRLLNKDGSPMMYQFFVLDANGLRVKHFTSELVGWENKDSFKNFKMMNFSDNLLAFEGLTYKRKSKDEFEIQMEIQRGDQIETEVFLQKRKYIAQQRSR